MLRIQEEILKKLPKDKVSEVVFEGPLIVIYVKDKELFLKGKEIGAKLAKEFKKRFEIRIDPNLLPEDDVIKERIEKIVPKEAELRNIYIERARSIVIIECLRPEKITDEILEKIKEETLLIPKVKRAPIQSSKIIDAIRAYLYSVSEERKKLLHKVGEKIVAGWGTKSKRKWVRISILGAGQEVGRSAILLQTPESNVLLDFGIGVNNTGPDAFPHLDAPEFDIQKLDAVIITHAHLDHVGLLPFLFKLGWKGPVYMTEPTRDLAALVCLDYIKVSEQQNKQSLYSSSEIREMLKHTITLNYGEVTDITPDIKITFNNAGHILGSAMVHLNIGNGLHNILYTGDFKFSKTRLLDPPKTIFPRLETVIMESTYGGKNDIHPSREETEKKFLEAVKETLSEGGKVLIPVLAVGRAQEILLLIIDAVKQGILPPVDVYLEGVLWETTMIHTAYPEFLSKELKEEIERGENPFEAEFIYRASPKDRENIMNENKPAIIIATSGMMNGGPIVDYFRLGAEDPRNLLAFVSYQARGTLGRLILDGAKEVNINGELVKVRLKVQRFEGFSGHADRKELLKFVSKLNPKPKNVVIVHGEPPKPFELASGIKSLYKKQNINVNVYVPKNLDAIRLR